MASTTIKNVSSWKLNQAEKKEVADRVLNGEDERTVTRELQQKKAEASQLRKTAAAAVASTCSQQQTALQSKPKAKAQAKSRLADASERKGSDDADATNKAYYQFAQSDLQTILKEYGKELQNAMPLTISSTEAGVQDAFCKTKAQQAMSANGVYRCSISVFWINPLASATPGIPMSRKRVQDLSDFSYGAAGTPRWHTDRMVEIAVAKSDLETDTPTNLVMVSPEELIHATLAGCARAIKLLGFIHVFFLQSTKISNPTASHIFPPQCLFCNEVLQPAGRE